MSAAACHRASCPCNSVVLLNGALERIAAARRSMECEALAEQSRLLHTASSFIDALRGGLDLRRGDPLAANFDDLYEYLARRLGAADRLSDPQILAEVADLLQQVRAAWSLLPPYARAQRGPAPAIKE
jgi:flagellar secretion chaperone FliS